MSISDEALNNRKTWDSYSDEYQKTHGDQLDRKEFAWGVWSIPDSELNILGDPRGKEILELGCGAAQLSIAIKYMGARPSGIDNSSKQLEHARKNIKRHGFDFPLIHAAAESLPFSNEVFDMVFCDHGAMSFSPSDPTLKEVRRVLKPGGRFIFNAESTIRYLCDDYSSPLPANELKRNYFEIGQSVDPDDGTIYFHNSFGDWVRLFRKNHFHIVDLVEIKPPAEQTSSYQYVSQEWAQKWPAENIWIVEKEK